MILVSKDRTTVYNFEHVHDICLDGMKIVFTVGYEDRRPLNSTAGLYDSESRAQMVFNDLIRAIGEAAVNPIGVIYLAED